MRNGKWLLWGYICLFLFTQSSYALQVQSLLLNESDIQDNMLDQMKLAGLKDIFKKNKQIFKQKIPLNHGIALYDDGDKFYIVDQNTFFTGKPIRLYYSTTEDKLFWQNDDEPLEIDASNLFLFLYDDIRRFLKGAVEPLFSKQPETMDYDDVLRWFTERHAFFDRNYELYDSKAREFKSCYFSNMPKSQHSMGMAKGKKYFSISNGQRYQTHGHAGISYKVSQRLKTVGALYYNEGPRSPVEITKKTFTAYKSKIIKFMKRGMEIEKNQQKDFEQTIPIGIPHKAAKALVDELLVTISQETYGQRAATKPPVTILSNNKNMLKLNCGGVDVTFSKGAFLKHKTLQEEMKALVKGVDKKAMVVCPFSNMLSFDGIKDKGERKYGEAMFDLKVKDSFRYSTYNNMVKNGVDSAYGEAVGKQLHHDMIEKLYAGKPVVLGTGIVEISEDSQWDTFSNFTKMDQVALWVKMEIKGQQIVNIVTPVDLYDEATYFQGVQKCYQTVWDMYAQDAENRVLISPVLAMNKIEGVRRYAEFERYQELMKRYARTLVAYLGTLKGNETEKEWGFVIADPTTYDDLVLAIEKDINQQKYVSGSV